METWECGDVRQGGLLLKVRLLLNGDLQCLINRNDSRRGYVNLHEHDCTCARTGPEGPIGEGEEIGWLKVGSRSQDRA